MKETKSKNATLTVDRKDYALEVIQSTCHYLEPRLRFSVKPKGTSVAVTISPRRDQDEKDFSPESVISRFEEELMYQAIRHRVSQSNQKIREHIVTRALLSCQQTSGQKPQNGSANFQSVLDENLEQEIQKLLAEIGDESGGSDPLKIAVPWEAKNPEVSDVSKEK